MNSQKTDPKDAAGGAPRTQDAAGAGPADAPSAEAARAHGNHHAITQAARSVMHPEQHDLEWRFYHGAVHG